MNYAIIKVPLTLRKCKYVIVRWYINSPYQTESNVGTQKLDWDIIKWHDYKLTQQQYIIYNLLIIGILTI